MQGRCSTCVICCSKPTQPTHLGLAQQRTRDAQQLALPGGEVVTPLRDSRLQAQRQRRDVLLQYTTRKLLSGKASIMCASRLSDNTQEYSHQALSAKRQAL